MDLSLDFDRPEEWPELWRNIAAQVAASSSGKDGKIICIPPDEIPPQTEKAIE